MTAGTAGTSGTSGGDHPPTRPTVDLDHHAPAFSADPLTALRRLQAECPIAWSESHGGFWVLTRYRDVRDALTDHGRFSSRHDLEPGSPFQGVTIPPPPMRFVPVEVDPPEFFAYRRLLNPLFSPAAVAAVRHRIVAYTDWCLDQVSAAGRLDFVHDLASPVPAMVTLEIMGLPVAEWRRFATTFHDLAASPPGSAGFEAAVASATAIADDLHQLVADRRSRPGRERRGGIDALVDAEIGGRPLPVDLVVDIVRLVLAGGIDTTTGAAAGAFAYLGDHHETRQRLAGDPSLLATAVDEVIRWTTPTPLLGRTTTCPVGWPAGDGASATVDAGAHERVMLNLFAANRDPAAFSDPDGLVLDRYPNRHVAFGAGIHRCVGANLARAELQVMIERVLARMPDYRLEPGVTGYASAGVQNGYAAVPASFAAVAPVGADPGFPE